MYLKNIKPGQTLIRKIGDHYRMVKLNNDKLIPFYTPEAILFSSTESIYDKPFIDWDCSGITIDDLQKNWEKLKL